MAIDGYPTQTTHSRHGTDTPYGQEDHWMEFELMGSAQFPLEISIFHGHPQTRRFLGCLVELKQVADGENLHSIVVEEEKRNYCWHVEDPGAHCGPLRVCVKRPLSLGVANDIHHLHISSLSLRCIKGGKVKRWVEYEVMTPFATPVAFVANIGQKLCRTNEKCSFVEIKAAPDECDGHTLKRFDFISEESLCMMHVALHTEMVYLLVLLQRLRREKRFPQHVSHQILDLITPLHAFFKHRNSVALRCKNRVETVLIVDTEKERFN